jgi:deoxyribodipyrimidine photo-lyase
MKQKIKIFWFRRDLRLLDNAGLYHALSSDHVPVLPIFIFDKHILDKLPSMDARVDFIHKTLMNLSEELQKLGSAIKVFYGQPEVIWQTILEEYDVQSVFTNHDYEPYAISRDEKVKQILDQKDIQMHTFKDHVIFEGGEVLKDDGKPYTVFTPYKRKWYEKLNSRIENGEYFYFKAYPTEKYFNNLFLTAQEAIPSLQLMGFGESTITIPSTTVSQKIIANYDKTRDFPSINGTSLLGIHFRFGTISVREKALKALGLNTTYLNELIWRDFYSMILSHFPHIVHNSFREEYDQIPWLNNEADFEAWKMGKTGYPMVDAGMRQLNATGYMHNRVRMITASFLTKHLLIDWRWGEAYFAEKLLDFDLASNNGGWQWAAGSGTDAAPYFRIFSPASQQEKFDNNYEYVKKWIPEFGTSAYPKPIVDHKLARERCLRVYKEGLGK